MVVMGKPPLPRQQICTVVLNSLLHAGWTQQPRGSLLQFSIDCM